MILAAGYYFEALSESSTAQKMQKSLIENFIFCAVIKTWLVVMPSQGNDVRLWDFVLLYCVEFQWLLDFPTTFPPLVWQGSY